MSLFNSFIEEMFPSSFHIFSGLCLPAAVGWKLPANKITACLQKAAIHSVWSGLFFFPPVYFAQILASFDVILIREREEEEDDLIGSIATNCQSLH